MTGELKPPALDPEAVPAREGSSYPGPFKELCRARAKRVLGDVLGLGNFGVNLVTLPPGAWSAQRHWHSHEDEFVYVIDGELALVTEDGEQLLCPGHVAGFPAGRADGHNLVNKGGGARHLPGNRRPQRRGRVHLPRHRPASRADAGRPRLHRQEGGALLIPRNADNDP